MCIELSTSHVTSWFNVHSTLDFSRWIDKLDHGVSRVYISLVQRNIVVSPKFWKMVFIASIWYKWSNLPYKFVVFSQFASKFELLSVNCVVIQWFHSLFQTLKLNFLKKRKLVVTTIFHWTSELWAYYLIFLVLLVDVSRFCYMPPRRKCKQTLVCVCVCLCVAVVLLWSSRIPVRSPSHFKES